MNGCEVGVRSVAFGASVSVGLPVERTRWEARYELHASRALPIECLELMLLMQLRLAASNLGYTS